MKSGARRMLVTLTVILVVLYMVGGVRGVRQLRARVRAWMQPPTAEEMQHAAPDTVPTLPRAVTRTRDGRTIPLSEPPTVGAIVGVICGVLILTVALMAVTARDHPRSY
jgi:hypothetical protein